MRPTSQVEISVCTSVEAVKQIYPTTNDLPWAAGRSTESIPIGLEVESMVQILTKLADMLWHIYLSLKTL